MKPSILAFVIVAGLAFGSLVNVANARDPSPAVYSFHLNGEPTRPAGEDAGGQGIRGLLLQGTTGVASVPVAQPGQVYRVDCQADGGAAHICAASTDGGCSADPTDINWGPVVNAGGFIYITTQNTSSTGVAKRIYATGDTAVQFTCPVTLMQ